MHSLSRLLSIPFILILILYFTIWQYSSESADTWMLLPSFGALVMLYISNKEIDRWWWKRRPPALDERMGQWLTTHSPYLMGLNSKDTKRFVDRLAVFMHVKEYTLKADRDFHLQEEFKAIIAHEYVRLTMHHDDYLYGHYDNFVVYNHPFGTPDYQELHSVEVNREDGVVILSRLELVDGFDGQKPHFNTALYSAILAYISLHPRADYPDITDISPNDIIEKIIGLDTPYMSALLGPSTRPSVVALLIYAHMEHREELSQQMPYIAEKIRAIIGDDSPVINIS